MIAIDRQTYNNVFEVLHDYSTTYKIIHKNPIKKMVSDTIALLKRWKTNGYISQATYKYLYPPDSSLPRAYGLPKLHKQGTPI